MRERPILFSGEMVRAILAGRKTQTRRPMNADHWPIAVEPNDKEYVQSDGSRLREWYRFSAKTAALIEFKRPGGNMGRDRPPTKRMLKWAEGWRRDSRWSMDEVAGLCPYGQPGDRLWVRETWAAHWMYDAVPPTEARSGHNNDNQWFAADPTGTPGTHGCPTQGRRGKWRPSIHMPRWASRLTLEITGARVERLGDISEEDARAEGTAVPQALIDGVPATVIHAHRDAFGVLWRSVYGAESWDANPWVWVVGFKRVETEVAR